jgi:DNA-binding beta-propeller fold protein YncE
MISRTSTDAAIAVVDGFMSSRYDVQVVGTVLKMKLTFGGVKSAPFIALGLILVAAAVFAITAIGPPHNGGGTSNQGSTLRLTSTMNFKVLNLVQTIQIPDVTGRIDHMDIDLLSQTLFVAALGNNSVVAVDLVNGRILRALGGFDEPQGVLYVPASHALFVSNGGNGTVDILNADTFTFERSVQFSSDADNMRYDRIANLVYVGYGQGYDSGLGVINASSGLLLRKIQLGNHPESFELEENGTRIFVNVPYQVATYAVNKTSGVVLSSWRPDNATANFPLALSENGNRLFVGTWYPPKLLVFDTRSGDLLSSVNISKDADDIYFDSATRLIYISCGEGFIDIVGPTSTGYAVVDTVATREGARTSLFVPASHQLIVGAPSRGGPAEILVFDVNSPNP